MNELSRIIAETVRETLKSLGVLKPEKPAPVAAPTRRQGRVLSLDYGAGPAREETELERIQRSFAFQREHGGLFAEARRNQWGEFEWRRYR